MAPVDVPGITRKLRLLCDHGRFRNLDELADKFGVKRSAMEYWGHGKDGTRKPNMLPSKHLATFSRLIAEALGEEDQIRIQELISAQPSALDEALQEAAVSTFARLVDAEGVSGRAALFRMASNGAGLVEFEEPDLPEPEFTLPLRQWFRLEFRLNRPARYAFALQHAGRSWGLIPTCIDQEAAIIHLPGRRLDGSLAHMIERSQPTRHRFIVAAVPAPCPAAINRYNRDDIGLDVAALRHLAAFYEAQTRTQRALYTVDIVLEGSSKVA